MSCFALFQGIGPRPPERRAPDRCWTARDSSEMADSIPSLPPFAYEKPQQQFGVNYSIGSLALVPFLQRCLQNIAPHLTPLCTIQFAA